MLEVYIDGACEPNPGGKCGYGLVVIRNSECLLSESKFTGQGKLMTNNVGEYSALIAFLRWYIKYGDSEEGIIHSDSQLLINQIIGNWRAKSGLYMPYYLNVQSILKNNGLQNRFKYKWIPREENIKADNLSKLAINLKEK